MLKFLANCHDDEGEISHHLKKEKERKKKKKGYWPVHMNGNKFATGQILKKPHRSCEGADFSWLTLKVSRTLLLDLDFFFLSKLSFLDILLSVKKSTHPLLGAWSFS
jgi:hypothetical protein